MVVVLGSCIPNSRMFVLPPELPGAFRARARKFPMTMYPKFLAAGAAAVAFAVPAAAQSPYPYPYPQQTYPQGYPGYQQPYGGNVVGQIVNQLLGNRYNVTDRNAVSQCATASMMQASRQYGQQGYGGYGQQGYGGYPGYQQGYAQQGYNPAM